MMKKIFKFFVVLLMLVTFSFSIASCSGGEAAKKEFIVTFNSTGGSEIEAQKVRQSEKAIEPSNPIKDGFDFNGWYLEDIEYDFNTLVTSDITLIAHWKEITSFNVIFNTDGGSEIPAIKVDKNANIAKPNDPVKSGYTFVGWYLGEEAFDFSTYKVTGDITLIAHWKEEQQEAKIYTVAEILELCEKDTNERYLVRGTITKISNPLYGEMTIKDDTGEVFVYGTYDKTGEKRYPDLEDKPYEGDEILISGIATIYKGKKEIKSAWIQEVKHNAPAFNEADYEEMSIKNARNAALNTKVKLTGVVAKITYASGLKPSGVMLVDNTEAIYVYDKMIASEANIGNTLTVCGERDSWINPDESNSASKFGYKGCTQISKCHKIKLEKTESTIDFSWVKENTIKNIIENNPENDITSTIFKVNGLVKKSVNPGFTNYFIDDIDGKTGSYVYTQCNGNDLDYLEEFDGKICTIYLSPLNAKATSSGIQYRFLPIALKDENYQFDLNKANDLALDYVAIDQFGNDYMINPNLELADKVSFTHLGVENVQLSYTSSNENAIKFVTENGKIIMQTINTSNASVDVTIKATFNGKSATRTITINVLETPKVDFIDIKAALAADFGSTLTVKGIVGASLVNRNGFYLIDDNGIIAVTTTKDVLENLALGQEVIVKGTKTLYGKSSSDPEFKYQIVLNNSELVLNYYGNHPYSIKSFEEKSLAEVKSLDVNVHENTTKGYIISNVQVKFVTGAYSTNVFIVDGEQEIMLYCTGSSQYNWLKAYDNKTIKIELAVCNWNSAKGGYKGTVLAVYNEDGTKTVNNLNFNK